MPCCKGSSSSRGSANDAAPTASAPISQLVIARQMLELADAARVDDGEHLPPPHDAAAQEAQHRHRHRAQREAARRGREVGIAEELEHAGVDRQEVGDGHAEMRAAGEQQVEEAEPDRAGDAASDSVAVQSAPIAAATRPTSSRVKPVERSQCRSRPTSRSRGRMRTGGRVTTRRRPRLTSTRQCWHRPASRPSGSGCRRPGPQHPATDRPSPRRRDRWVAMDHGTGEPALGLEAADRHGGTPLA